jgi:hypothetical protein
MWFWQDNGPAHFTHVVKDHLNPAFMIARFGHGGRHHLATKLDDLALFDFFSWGHLKSLIY